MMHSGSPASGLNGLLMSLGGTLSLQDGAEGLPADGRFSKLFKQLMETPEGAARLSQALSDATADADMALPESLAGELSEQDWQQLEAAWQSWQQQADQPLPPAGQPLPASVEDLLQQVRSGQSLVVSEPVSEASGVTPIDGDLMSAQAMDTAGAGNTDISTSQAQEQQDKRLGLDVMVSVQRPSVEASVQETTPASAGGTGLNVSPLAEPRHRQRLGPEMPTKSGSTETQSAVTWAQSSGEAGEATVEDAERPTGLQQRESSDGERMMGESGAKPLELEPARPAANTAQTQVQTATASTNVPTMAATTDETISFNDPLVEDAFELQEKRELNQLRGDERLRERLDLGTDRQGWGLALGSRIVAMVADEVQQARIHLDPPELGSMEIRLQVQQEQTSIQVQVQNPQVREALEANAHRLREALAENGLALAGFDVAEQGSQQSGQHNDGGEGQAQSGWMADGDGDEAGSVSESTATAVSSDALLDTFA